MSTSELEAIVDQVKLLPPDDCVSQEPRKPSPAKPRSADRQQHCRSRQLNEGVAKLCRSVNRDHRAFAGQPRSLAG